MEFLIFNVKTKFYHTLLTYLQWATSEVIGLLLIKFTVASAKSGDDIFSEQSG